MYLNTALPLSILAIIGCAPDEHPTQPATGEEITAPSFAAAANSWTSKAKIPTAREQLTAGVINNSAGQPILYAIGGYVSGSVATVEAYNFATNTWSTKAPLPRGVSETNGAGVIGGKLYVSGGVSYANDEVEIPPMVSSLYVYNPPRNTWTRKADMPWASSGGVTGVINKKLYVLVDSCEDDCGSRRLLRYDPATNTWDASLPRSPSSHSGGVGGVISGKFYVTGGNSANSLQLEVYDPVTNTWTTKAPMPSFQIDAAAAVASNKLYVIGGRGASDGDGIRLRTVRMYNPVNNTWNTRTQLPTSRIRLAAAQALLNGRSYILAVSGFGESGFSRDNHAYAP